MADGDRVLEELRQVDERTLRFSPWGFGGRLEPSVSARFLAESLARTELSEAVPEEIRLNFERVRRLCLYGLLEYDLFSAAHDLAHLVLEGAFRHRFISYYDGQIPVLRDGEPDQLVAASFDDYRNAVLRAQRSHVSLGLVEDRGGDRAEGLPRTYPQLFGWARRRGLLVGQRNVGVFGAMVRLRDDAAHPERHRLDMPPEVIHLLRDVAEIINRLWGQNTEGGRLFPAPVSRRPRAAALSPDGQASVTFGSLRLIPFERDKADWTYAIFLAADAEELTDFNWDGMSLQRFRPTQGFQMTQYPAECLWGPGNQSDLLETLSSFDDSVPTDAVHFLDRIFYIRTLKSAERPEFPRSSEDVRATTVDDASAVWYVIRADFPMDAWILVRDHEESLAADRERTGFVSRLVGDDAARRHAR